MAINAPVQGTAADVMRVAMNEVYNYIKKEKLEDEVHMLLQVHDELVFEIAEKNRDLYIAKIKEIMEGVLGNKPDRGVPIAVSVGVGNSWGDLNPL